MPPETSDWPDPVEVLNESGSSDILLLCEHASNHIPADYLGLGLPPADLQRHIAWDPGAAMVTRALSARLDAAAFLGTYSRLLIDLNRPLAAIDSIVKRSEETDIPGNADVATEEAQRRAETMFTPFHQRVGEHLDARRRPTRLVTIHSFTPVFRRVTRPWHAGVLFIDAAEFGQVMIDGLREPGLLVDANVPYKSDRAGDYSIPIHGDDRGIPAVLIEIRNDLIADPAGVDRWVDRLARVLRS